jgi:hypothetical protein
MSAILGNPAPAKLCPVLYKLDIHLAGDEWGNGLMTELAAEALADPRYANYQPLVVTVHEHAGWWLEFALVDGWPTVVGTANDLAVFQGTAKRFRDQYQHADVHRAGMVRRKVRPRCGI